MQLYAGSSRDFIDAAFRGRIATQLAEAYERAFRHAPPRSEVQSWQNSLRSMSWVLEKADLTDHGVLLEHQLPMTSKRLDCLVTGRDADARDQAVVVELKQWSEAGPSEAEGCVTTFLGGRVRDVLHPSVQVGQYAQYLEDYREAFTQGDVRLSACAYLHNLPFDPDDELFADRHRGARERYPVFTADASGDLVDYLAGRMAAGHGEEVLQRVVRSPSRPSKKLLSHTAEMVQGQTSFVLLDEQLVVFERVLAEARKATRRAGKSVVLVRGGPGTGKSVVALHLVGRLAGEGFDAQHATGSKWFTENVRSLVGRRASHQFRYFHTYAKEAADAVDVLVSDEAHRIRATSANRFTKKEDRTGRPQVEELVHAAKVSVFFLDDLQVVRPNEVGSTDLIRDAASRVGADLIEFELEAQFRCGGSDGFVQWVDNTLQIRRTPSVLWEGDDAFEFGVLDDVAELEVWVRAKNDGGDTARMVAGFCWPWSNPNADGTLVDDVVVGDWARPWNAKPDAGRLAKGIPKAHVWATDPGGLDQVGCIYTAQGFEFDYVGVIVGRDLRWDPAEATWVADPTESYDRVVKRSGEAFLDLVKHTYRVLLTRGMKGCKVVFLDDATRDFVRSRLDLG
ncbi:MAG: DUF2075 domain-containing protein [Trueperaceae bacterium]|nr:DUF2075 domain-containing protein [Trueperaceae bacterium]